MRPRTLEAVSVLVVHSGSTILRTAAAINIANHEFAELRKDVGRQTVFPLRDVFS